MWRNYNFPVYLLSESGISAVHEVILQTCILLQILNVSICVVRKAKLMTFLEI